MEYKPLKANLSQLVIKGFLKKPIFLGGLHYNLIFFRKSGTSIGMPAEAPAGTGSCSRCEGAVPAAGTRAAYAEAAAAAEAGAAAYVVAGA